MMDIPDGLESWLASAQDVPDDIRTWLEGLLEMQNSPPGRPDGGTGVWSSAAGTGTGGSASVESEYACREYQPDYRSSNVKQ